MFDGPTEMRALLMLPALLFAALFIAVALADGSIASAWSYLQWWLIGLALLAAVAFAVDAVTKRKAR
jgi:hypothetical protein